MKNLNFLAILALAVMITVAAVSPAPPSWDSGMPHFKEDIDTGYVPIQAFFWSIQNLGPATGTVSGVTLAVNSTVSSAAFPTFMQDTIEYDADGNTFVVYYLTKN